MLLSGGGQVGNFLTQGGKVFPPWVGKFSHLSPPLRSFRDLATSWGTSALTVVPQLIKRLLQFFERALPSTGIEPAIFHFMDGCSSPWITKGLCLDGAAIPKISKRHFFQDIWFSCQWVTGMGLKPRQNFFCKNISKTVDARHRQNFGLLKGVAAV